MSTYYLAHHGVKGMKWGVRRAQKKAARADRAIRRIGDRQKQNKIIYDRWNDEATEKYSGRKTDKKLRKTLASNKALYDDTEVSNKYYIECQKARKDKSHKKSATYIQAKNAFSKQQAQKMIYGDFGHRRIETLKNLGQTEKQAKGRVIAESAMIAVGAMAVSAAMAYISNKYN